MESEMGKLGWSEFQKDGVEFVVKKLCKEIREKLNERQWKEYEEGKGDRSRIELFVRKKEIQSCVLKYLKSNPGTKDKAKAMILKNAGNKSFASGDNSKALALYTQCLAYMPHENDHEHDEGSKDAAVVYANRSAALFHLEEFSLSKIDAEIAFGLNYPSELHYKLYERLGRCCQHLGLPKDEAIRHFHAAIKALDSAKGLDAAKKKKAQKVLEDLVKSPPILDHGFHQNKGSSTLGCRDSLPDLPEVYGGLGKYLPVASSRLNVKYSEKRGRYVTTTELIRPGEVILVERPYVSVLYPESYHKQCFQCFVALKAPIVCESCIFASFCSQACQEKARKHHKYECSILGVLKNCGISVICYMGIRTLTQADPKSVLGWYPLAEATESDDVVSDLGNNSGDKIIPGINEEYRTDHHALFSLVTHSKKRNPEDFLHQIVMALFLLETLKTTSYFDIFKGKIQKEGGRSDTEEGRASGPKGNEGGCEKSLSKNGSRPTQTSISENEAPCREDIPLEVEIKFAVLLLRCLKSLQFNTHETAGWDENRDKDHSVGLGGALYPTLALFNHSCNAAIVRYMIKDVVVVRAVKTILPGEEVTENYGANYSTQQLEERQARLRDYYWFQCDCIACREDWPTFENMTNMIMKFRCGKCRTFICKADESMGILFKCGKCGQSVNVLKILKSLQDSETKYTQAVNFISSGQQEIGLGMLLENLFLLESHLMPPFREMHMSQEYLRRCYLSTGNKVSVLPTWDPETLKVSG